MIGRLDMDDLDRRMLTELHDAIIGTAQRPGLAEQVRGLDTRLTKVEALVTRAGQTLWDKGWALIAAGAAGWVTSHFPGTRP